MNPSGLCVLGTDTGVGKTTVGVGLLRLASRRSVRLLPYKPVETGCTSSPSDVDRLVQATADPHFSSAQAGTYRFPEPTAPSVAARLAGQAIDLDHIVRRAGDIIAGGAGAHLLVETAGGLLTPYGAAFTSSTLAEALLDHFDFDVLLVSANRLGTINQTALAIDHLARTRCRVAGVVLVDVHAEHTPDQPYNAAEIQGLTGARILGTLRHCPPSPDDIADAVAVDLDLRPVLGGILAT